MALRSLLRKLFGGGTPTPERRDAGFGGAVSLETAWNTGAGLASSPWFGENLATVVSAVTIISRTIGSLPAVVYQTTPEGRIEAPTHPVQRLLARPDGPDGILSWPDFCEWFIASMLLSGNAVAAIDDNGAGVPVALRPVPWWCANPVLTVSGRVVFHPVASQLPWWTPGRPETLSSSDVLWLRDRTDNAVFGRSALSRAPQVIQSALNAQSFAAAMFASGAKLSGIITHPGKLSAEASARVGASWAATHTGPGGAGKTAILEEGMSFQSLSMTLEDAELLASRKLGAEDIAKLFNIPLPILNIWDHSTFTNSDTASQWFAQLCLAPICRKLEAEASRVLFNDPAFHMEIDLSAMMRGSFATRIQTEIAMVRAGVISADEMRLAEGWPARGGDADKLVAQATGGRPQGAGDGEGDQIPQPGARPNGGGKSPNGHVA